MERFGRNGWTGGMKSSDRHGLYYPSALVLFRALFWEASRGKSTEDSGELPQHKSGFISSGAEDIGGGNYVVRLTCARL